MAATVGVSLLEEDVYSEIKFQAADLETHRWLQEHVMGTLVPCLQELIRAVLEKEIEGIGEEGSEQKYARTTPSMNPIDWLASLLMRHNPRHNPSMKQHPYFKLLSEHLLKTRKTSLSLPLRVQTSVTGASSLKSSLRSPRADDLHAATAVVAAPLAPAVPTATATDDTGAIERMRSEMQEKKRATAEENVRDSEQFSAAMASIKRRTSVVQQSIEAVSSSASTSLTRRSSQVFAVHRGDTPPDLTPGSPVEEAEPNVMSEDEKLDQWRQILQRRYEEQKASIPAFLDWLEAEVSEGKADNPTAFSELCEQVVHRLAGSFDGIAAYIGEYNRETDALVFSHVSENCSPAMRSLQVKLERAQFPNAPSFQALDEGSSLFVQGVAASREVVALGDFADRGDGDLFVGAIVIGPRDESVAVLVVDSLTGNERAPPTEEELALFGGSPGPRQYKGLDEEMQLFLQQTVGLLSSAVMPTNEDDRGVDPVSADAPAAEAGEAPVVEEPVSPTAVEANGESQPEPEPEAEAEPLSPLSDMSPMPEEQEGDPEAEPVEEQPAEIEGEGEEGLGKADEGVAMEQAEGEAIEEGDPQSPMLSQEEGEGEEVGLDEGDPQSPMLSQEEGEEGDPQSPMLSQGENEGEEVGLDENDPQSPLSGGDEGDVEQSDAE